MKCKEGFLVAALVIGIVLEPGPATLQAAGLYGLLDTGEVYRSTDGGTSWSAIGAIPVGDAAGIAAGSSSTDLYVATKSGGIYRSSNGGTTWTAVGAAPASDLCGFTITPGGALLVLSRTGSLYSSIDQGASFTPIFALQASDWSSLTRGPLGRMYALTSTGQVAESQDQGGNWTTVGSIVTSSAVSLQRLGSLLYVIASTGEVYRSLDYGRTWLAVGALSQGSVSALVHTDDKLIAATSEGEVAATSDGVAWSWVGVMNQLHVTALGTDSPQITGIEAEDAAPRFLGAAPRPNPSLGSQEATFDVMLATADGVRLDLYDVRGRLVCEGPRERLEQGAGRIRWKPMELPAGTYLVRLRTSSGQHASMKWTIMR